MVGKIAGMGIHSGLTIETTLDPAIQPFLHDHQIDGTPVLPGVMGIEAFAEAALCMLPGWHIEAIEDVNFLAPFKFYRNEPRTVTVEAVIHPRGDTLLADCRLIGRRSLPNQAEPQVTTHFTARVRLAKQMPRSGDRASAGLDGGTHHRSRRHLSHLLPRARIPGCGAGVVGRTPDCRADGKRLASKPSAVRAADVMAPRLIELCFQTAGVWEMGAQGRMGLPQHIDRVSSLLLPAPESADSPLIRRGHS